MAPREPDSIQSNEEHFKHALCRLALSAALAASSLFTVTPATSAPCEAPQGAACPEPESEPRRARGEIATFQWKSRERTATSLPDGMSSRSRWSTWTCTTGPRRSMVPRTSMMEAWRAISS